MGLNEPIEQGLRELKKRDERIQRERRGIGKNSWTGVRG